YRSCNYLGCRLRFCFFFSSRRRHTRFSRDWSSDVCSSDLATCGLSRMKMYKLVWIVGGKVREELFRGNPYSLCKWKANQLKATRSEERRVGKEGRYRLCRYVL